MPSDRWSRRPPRLRTRRRRLHPSRPGGPEALSTSSRPWPKGCPARSIPNTSRDDLAALYGRSAVLVHAAGYGVDPDEFPESLEHFGITPVEASSFGCIPVVYGQGGPLDVIDVLGCDTDVPDDRRLRSRRRATAQRLRCLVGTQRTRAREVSGLLAGRLSGPHRSGVARSRRLTRQRKAGDVERCSQRVHPGRIDITRPSRMSDSDTMQRSRPSLRMTSRNTSAPPKMTSSRPGGIAGRAARVATRS